MTSGNVVIVTLASDAALLARHRAAVALVEAGELRGWHALGLVVYPPPELERMEKRFGPGGHQVVTEECRARALELIASGMSHTRAAKTVGIARTTVSGWVRDDRDRLQKQL